jgi:hypothetical protein
MSQMRLIRLCGVVLAVAVVGKATAGQEFEFFSQVGSTDGTYNREQVVSREAIPNDAWYQMETEWRVVVDAGNEAYVAREANVAQNQFRARIVGRKGS